MKGKLYYYYMNYWDKFAVREVVGEAIGKISVDRLYRNVIRLSHSKKSQTGESLLPQDLAVTADW